MYVNDTLGRKRMGGKYMIKKIAEIMLYVDNQEESKNFWTEKLGFIVVSDEDNGEGLRWIELVPAVGSETSLILHNKKIIAKMQPELNLATPSLMFCTEDIDRLHKDYQDKQVKVGELVTMPFGKVFNFADNEDHYFAVKQIRT